MGEAKAQKNQSRQRDIFVREMFETARAGLRYGLFAFLAYCGWRSIEALAGRATGADLKLALSAAIQVGKQDWTPWLVAVLLAAWAILERWYRHRTSRVLSARIAGLEFQLDSLIAREPTRNERRSAGG